VGFTPFDARDLIGSNSNFLSELAQGPGTSNLRKANSQMLVPYSCDLGKRGLLKLKSFNAGITWGLATGHSQYYTGYDRFCQPVSLISGVSGKIR
jgi:hypothetical protein